MWAGGVVFFGGFAFCGGGGGELDDNSPLDFVKIAYFPDMIPSLFPSWSG